MKHKLLAMLMILVLVFGLAGCGGSSDADLPAPEEKIAADLAGTTLKVFAAYGGKDEIFQAFEADTGIKVEYLDMSSGEVLARIRAEQGKPLGDIWFGGGVDSFIAAQTDGLLESYVSKEAEFVTDQYKDPDGYWTGISLVTVSFIVNTDRCAELGVDVPQTWQDLLKPEFKGEILMPNPSISGTAYTILSGILQTMGEEEGWAYMDQLNAQIPYYAKRGGEPPQKAALGEAAVGLAPDTGEDLKAEGYPIVSVFPRDGTPWWPSPVAILKGAENLEGAKVFVDWCLSEKGQQILRDNCPRVPAREGIELPECLAEIKDAELQDIDFVAAGNARDGLVEQWQTRYGQ
jgi:iron(III) transport system substrate-binding protein